MVDNSNKGQSPSDRPVDDAYSADRDSNGDGSMGVSSSGGEIANSSSVSRRLSEILLEESNGDLLLQRSDREDGVLRWLSALDMQVIGACRADERLKPLLKLNVSTGAAEDCLLSHLSQHFEPSEVGLLARCLCMPLVSIRVGKINKQRMLLTPTPIRGNLSLTLLPTSDLRLLFNGDDGSIERLATLSREAPCTDVEIEEISADSSGRSFLIKTSSDAVSYYWCSEKSKLLGDELLGKMKDLLSRKPSLAEVTGISDSRLNCFATHLRAYLAGSSMSTIGVSETTLSSDDSVNSSELRFPQSSFTVQEGSSFRSTLLVDSLPDYFSPSKSALATDSSNCTDSSSYNCSEKEKPTVAEGNKTDATASLNFSDVLGTSLHLPELQFCPSVPSQFSPHYCWCPPVVSAIQLPISFTESPTLPPLSSLLSSAKPSLNLSDLPPLDFSSLLPELPTSQQILTFTPLMCDPIVHIPVIDVCSSGQGYLVSAGPAISAAIPPNLGDPLLSNGESMVEKGARETLRMLISSSNQPKPRLLEVLPSVFYSGDDTLNVGSRGVYSENRGLDANRNIMTSMGFFLSEKSVESSDGKRCDGRDELSDETDETEKPSDSDAGED